MNRFRNSYQI